MNVLYSFLSFCGFHLYRECINFAYRSAFQTVCSGFRLTRLVVLVATRDIHCGEELLSSYFTVVH